MTAFRKHRYPSLPNRFLILATISLTLLCLMLGATWIWTRRMPDRVTRTAPVVSYEQSIDFRYHADVIPGSVYKESVVRSEDLPRWQVQGNPPLFRRTLLTQPVSTLHLEFPIQVSFDRPVQASGTVELQGTLTAPRLWQKKMVLAAPQPITAEGDRISTVLKSEINPRSLVAEISQVLGSVGIAPGTSTLTLKPVLRWKVDDLSQPISSELSAFYTIHLPKSTYVEIEERPPESEQRTIQQSYIEENRIQALNLSLPVPSVRRWSCRLTLALLPLLLVLWWQVWLQIQSRPGSAMLARLATHSVRSRELRLANSVSKVKVKSPKELLRLHTLTQRPIVDTPKAYCLVDGNICYIWPKQ